MKIATSALALFAAVSPLAAAQGSFNEITADSLSVQDGAAQSLEQIAITSDVAAPDEDVVILYASESSDLPVLGIGAAHVDCEGASKDIMIKRSAREGEEEQSFGEDSGSGRGRKGGSDDANGTETETESATATEDVTPAEGTMHTMSPNNGTEVDEPAATSSDNPTITAAPIAHKGPSADDNGDDDNDDDNSSTTRGVSTKDDKPTRAPRTRSTLTTTVRNATKTTKAAQPTASSSGKGRGRKGKGRGRKGKGKGRGKGKADDSSSSGKHKSQGRGKQRSD